MNTELRTLLCTTLLGLVLAVPAVQRAEGQVTPQPPQQPAEPKDKTEQEKEKKKDKNPQQEEERKKQQQAEAERKRQQQQAEEERKRQLQQDRKTQQSEQERQRLAEQQKRQEEELKRKREEEERQARQRRLSEQEQRERIQKQEQQISLYRKNIALQEQLAEKDAQILRQQNRIQQLRMQEEYEDRLRAQRARLMQARYDYRNDPGYYTAPNYRYQRDGRYYQTNQYGIQSMERALQAGYSEGYKAGRADRADRWQYDHRSPFAYRDANYGYDGRYINQSEYNHYFREGFQRGYDDGYNNRQNFGRQRSRDDDDGNVIEGINDEWLIAGAVVAAIIGYQVLTD
jgi:hypothetical protein